MGQKSKIQKLLVLHLLDKCVSKLRSGAGLNATMKDCLRLEEIMYQPEPQTRAKILTKLRKLHAKKIQAKLRKLHAKKIHAKLRKLHAKKIHAKLRKLNAKKIHAKSRTRYAKIEPRIRSAKISTKSQTRTA